MEIRTSKSQAEILSFPEGRKRVQELIKKGREKNYLLIAEVNDFFSEYDLSPESLDEIISMLEGNNISVVTSKSEGTVRNQYSEFYLKKDIILYR